MWSALTFLSRCGMLSQKVSGSEMHSFAEAIANQVERTAGQLRRLSEEEAMRTRDDGGVANDQISRSIFYRCPESRR